METIDESLDRAALKKVLRKELLAKRMAMPEAELVLKSRQIFERWRNRFSLKKVSFFHVFQTMHQKHEVETADYMDFVRERHPQINIVVPIVDSVNKVLRHTHVHEEVEMRVNKWGILEPHMPVDFVLPMQIDMVIVPLLGFDDSGQRLGYGAGYYDQFLALTRPACIKIGVCYDMGHLTQALPAEAHDIPLDFVITENTTIRFNPNFPI